MPRIRCNYEGCIHLEGALCTASEIELDQELGCLTFSQVDDEAVAEVEGEIEEEAEWEEELEEEEELEDDWADLEDEEEDEDDWDDEEEDEPGSGWSRRRSRH
jgi:hypothetical protein